MAIGREPMERAGELGELLFSLVMGRVMVNLATAGTDYHVPFGGRGDSSRGPREQGACALELCTRVKTAYVAAGEPG